VLKILVEGRPGVNTADCRCQSRVMRMLETEEEVTKLEGYLHDEETHNYVKYNGIDGK
jgi:hypothetical protein